MYVTTLLSPIQATLIRPLVVVLLLLLLFNVTSCDPNGPGDKPGSTNSIADLEARTVKLVNNYRGSMKPARSQLSVRTEIADQARGHSQNMASGKIPVSHIGVDDRFAAIRQAIPWRVAGENVVNMDDTHPDPAQTAFGAWLNSPEHLELMQSDWTYTGVGVAKADNGWYYFTQIFVLEQ
jgi:uncharacterized protein YkwD